MRKGIVMKLNKNKATLITDDCIFCEIKAFNGMYEGMEVCFNDIDIIKRKNSFLHNRHVQAACFVLMIFSSYLFLSFYQENIATYAYVGVDINPSIEMSLNKKGLITKVVGLDEDGIKVAEQLNIKQMDSVSGIKEIIIKTIDMGYLNEENSNDITVYTIINQKDNGGGDELAKKLKTAIKEEISLHHIDKDIETIVSDQKTKNIADKAGISVLKYINKETKPNAIQKDKNQNKPSKSNINDTKKIEKQVDQINKNAKIDNKDQSNKNDKIDNKEEKENKDKNPKYNEKEDKENKKNEDKHEIKDKENPAKQNK